MSSLKITMILASVLLFTLGVNVFGKEKPTIPPYETFEKIAKPYCGNLIKTDVDPDDLCEGYTKESEFKHPHDSGMDWEIEHYVLVYKNHSPQFIIYFVGLSDRWGEKGQVVIFERKRKLLFRKKLSVVFETNDFKKEEREKFGLLIAKRYGINFLTE